MTSATANDENVVIGPTDTNELKSQPTHSLSPPPEVSIDHKKFESFYEVLAISIDRTKVSKTTKILRGYTLEERGVQDVVIDEEDNRKRLVLLKRECVGVLKRVVGFFTRGSEKKLEKKRWEFRWRAVAKGL